MNEFEQIYSIKMEIDQNILEINIYNEFCNIDDNFMYSFFDDDKYPDERKVLIQLVSLLSG